LSGLNVAALFSVLNMRRGRENKKIFTHIVHITCVHTFGEAVARKLTFLIPKITTAASTISGSSNDRVISRGTHFQRRFPYVYVKTYYTNITCSREPKFGNFVMKSRCVFSPRTRPLWCTRVRTCVCTAARYGRRRVCFGCSSSSSAHTQTRRKRNFITFYFRPPGFGKQHAPRAGKILICGFRRDQRRRDPASDRAREQMFISRFII